ncbi:DUF2378 family protein [Hyalangium minutum]|uniref:TIGR02265 family protein n=1 Tax=Hyalangium minutum TaxID=394096 RepID=A0A085WJ30_9BACT|nr:DUF2378 family protein [Hyalangium minutum]KFE67693.1 hypothetical protein DB31_8176 [Hyalangium minutum]
MADELLVYEQTIEALFVRALGARLSPECRVRLREAGLDVSQKLKPAYSFDSWMKFIRIAAEELHPGLPLPEATFKLGEAYVDGFRETMLGRAVMSLLRVLGPRRTVLRATQNFRAGNNYTETRVAELAPGRFEVWMNEVGPYPEFTAGIIQAGVRMSGAKELRVEMFDYDGHACTYRITWKEASAGVESNGDLPPRTRRPSGTFRTL